MRQDADALEMVQRIAAGDMGPDVAHWLQHSVSTWLRSGGEVPLERCMHLPNTPKRLQLVRRDAWLIGAAELIPGSSANQVAEELSDHLAAFLSHGPWRHWRDLQDAPPGASGLRTALFYVAKFNDGEGLSAKQVWRIVGHRFDQKCLPIYPKLSIKSTAGRNQLKDE